jgi:hypothetical protein
MNTRTLRCFARAGTLTGAALLVSLAGCVSDGSYQSRGYSSRPAVQVQSSVIFEDDYDYYPRYATYYSRSRQEYVYRDGGRWVRRSEPAQVSVNLLFASPSIRMDFRDAPERHHRTVVRSYPKNWAPREAGHVAKDDRKPDKRNNRRDDNRRN